MVLLWFCCINGRLRPRKNKHYCVGGLRLKEKQVVLFESSSKDLNLSFELDLSCAWAVRDLDQMWTRPANHVLNIIFSVMMNVILSTWAEWFGKLCLIFAHNFQTSLTIFAKKNGCQMNRWDQGRQGSLIFFWINLLIMIQNGFAICGVGMKSKTR